MLNEAESPGQPCDRRRQVLVNDVGKHGFRRHGAVLHPGMVTTDRPITVLQAIMEAGGFTDSANLKAVIVVRQEGGKAHNYTVNVQALLKGKGNASFYLKPSDSVYIPETWY